MIMKKLNKLQINTERLLKNEELLCLRGGNVHAYNCYVGLPGGETIDDDFSFSSNSGLIGATAECTSFYRTYFPNAACLCD